MNDSGFIAVSINYRYGWDNGGGVCVGDTASLGLALFRGIQDVNAALRFLVSKADEYAIDTNWIFVGGASAGGTLALNCTYVTEQYEKERYPQIYAALGGLYNQTNNLTNKYSIKGIYSIAGGLGDSTVINAGNAVPTIFFQGDADEVIPVDHGTYLWCSNFPKLVGSLCIARQLEKYNKPAVAHILSGAGHGNNGDSGFDNPFMMSNTACFLKRLTQKPLFKAIFTPISPTVVHSCCNHIRALGCNRSFFIWIPASTSSGSFVASRTCTAQMQFISQYKFPYAVLQSYLSKSTFRKSNLTNKS